MNIRDPLGTRVGDNQAFFEEYPVGCTLITDEGFKYTVKEHNLVHYFMFGGDIAALECEDKDGNEKSLTRQFDNFRKIIEPVANEQQAR